MIGQSASEGVIRREMQVCLPLAVSFASQPWQGEPIRGSAKSRSTKSKGFQFPPAAEYQWKEISKDGMHNKTHNRLSVDKVLICLSINPYRHIIRRWNWKSACLSAFSRGILILLINLSAGGASAAGAMLVEACYRALTSGFYSALTQAFRFAQPVWAASAIPMILIPIIADSCEFAVHGIHGTQRLAATVAASMIFTAITTLLELFAMRRGVLVMGRNSRPLLEDLKSFPNLFMDALREAWRFIPSIFKTFWKGHLADRKNSLPSQTASRPSPLRSE
jgi:hypothetical protein